MLPVRMYSSELEALNLFLHKSHNTTFRMLTHHTGGYSAQKCIALNAMQYFIKSYHKGGDIISGTN